MAIDSNEEFNTEFQKLMLAFMLGDPTSFTQSQDIIKAEYFDDRLRPAVRFILEYSDQYHSLPTVEQVYAMTKIEVMDYPQAPTQSKWYLDRIEAFCRYRAIENVVLNGVELLNKGQGGDLERQIKEAMQISLVKDLGTSYFDNPTERLERLKDKSNFVETGWKVLDDKLYGGFTRGSLNIFAGGSGSGKSLFLQNLARKWALMGKNVIYITLELSEDLVNLRLDAMVTNKSTKHVLSNVRQTAVDIGIIAKKFKPGDLKVKKFPEAGTTCNTLRAYLKEYEIQEGRKPDALIIDYLDLMHPNNSKIDVSSLFTKDKYVSEEMRAIGSDWDIPVVSASQLNRQSVEAQEFDHSHIAGGISKINTADNVFGIFTSMSMKERGVYQLQFLKTRSSSATGQKIELSYDGSTMVIEDPPEDDANTRQRSDSLDEIKRQFQLEVQTARTPPEQPPAPAMSDPEAVPAGKKISEMAMPAGPAPSAGPLRADLAALIAKSRKTDQ
jgi:archaellum biogenesis ATPase FlaH